MTDTGKVIAAVTGVALCIGAALFLKKTPQGQQIEKSVRKHVKKAKNKVDETISEFKENMKQGQVDSQKA